MCVTQRFYCELGTNVPNIQRHKCLLNASKSQMFIVNATPKAQIMFSQSAAKSPEHRIQAIYIHIYMYV